MVSKEAMSTISVVPRLSDVLEESEENDKARISDNPTFYETISNDEDILKILVQVRCSKRELNIIPDDESQHRQPTN